MIISPRIAVPATFAALALVVGACGSDDDGDGVGDGTTITIEVPDVTAPDVTAPDITAPDVSAPDVDVSVDGPDVSIGS